MLPIILRTIWDRRIRIIASILICILFVWMYASFFPTIQDQADKFNELFSSYPEALLKAFGIENTDVFGSYLNFLGVEHFSLIWPIIVIILMITYASSAISGEIEDGTIEILLSQPISRTKVFLAKYLAGLIILILFVALTNLAIIPIAGAYDIEISNKSILMVSVIGALFGAAIYSLTFLLSSIFSVRSQPTFITTGLILAMYVVNILASLKESAEDLKYVSYFYYYDYQKALIDSQIEPLYLWVFIGSIIIFTVAGWLCFLRRDI